MENIVTVDMSLLGTELEKERTIMALFAKIKYGEIVVKKRGGKIEYCQATSSYKWHIEDNKEKV